MNHFEKLPWLVNGGLVLMLVIDVLAFPPLLPRIGNEKSEIGINFDDIRDMNDGSEFIVKTVPLQFKDQIQIQLRRQRDQLSRRINKHQLNLLDKIQTHDQHVFGFNHFDAKPPMDLRIEFSSDESNPYIENVRQRYEFLAGGYEDIVR